MRDLQRLKPDEFQHQKNIIDNNYLTIFIGKNYNFVGSTFGEDYFQEYYDFLQNINPAYPSTTSSSG